MSAGDEGFLARWSRRKLQSRGTAAAPAQPQAPKPSAPRRDVREEAAPSPPVASPQTPPHELPPLASLTPESDFAPFMRAGVDPATKGVALKTLFSDPALYPMDGLDVYIDDYTKPDPLPPGWLERLNQLASLHGEPPAAVEPPSGAQLAKNEAAPAEPGTAAANGSSKSSSAPQDPEAAEGPRG